MNISPISPDSATAAPVGTSAHVTPLEWSVRLADSALARHAGSPPKWDYASGFFTLSLLKLNAHRPDPRYVAFAEKALGSLVSPDGEIQGYDPAACQLDALNPGKTLLALWQLTREEKYLKAIHSLYRQLSSQPRNVEGGFWHKQLCPDQMWLDGIYMSAPFYAQCAQLFGPPSAFDDIARQIHLLDVHAYDPVSGLFYHGWDAARIQRWANPVTGTSSSFWGRAIGWFGMVLVDVLDFFPTSHPARPAIIATLEKLCAGVVKYQDAETGLWFQILDQGRRPGNYVEATASAMFIYALAKGINRSYLSRHYLPALEKAYAGLIQNLVAHDEAGGWSLKNCCAVGGLGDAPGTGRYRDGSFAYYTSEPVVKNDLKGISPFVLDGIELQPLLKHK